MASTTNIPIANIPLTNYIVEIRKDAKSAFKYWFTGRGKSPKQLKAAILYQRKISGRKYIKPSDIRVTGCDHQPPKCITPIYQIGQAFIAKATTKSVDWNRRSGDAYIVSMEKKLFVPPSLGRPVEMIIYTLQTFVWQNRMILTEREIEDLYITNELAPIDKRLQYDLLGMNGRYDESAAGMGVSPDWEVQELKEIEALQNNMTIGDTMLKLLEDSTSYTEGDSQITDKSSVSIHRSVYPIKLQGLPCSYCNGVLKHSEDCPAFTGGSVGRGGKGAEKYQQPRSSGYNTNKKDK